MELGKELLVVTGRIFTIIPLLLCITFFMGKRSIGELPIFDFLIIITLGAVVGADIADPKIQHIHTAVAIIVIGVFQKVVSKLVIRYRKFGHVITFEPTIVIQEGQFIVKNLKKISYSIDNILQMLREKDVFDVSDVHLGIVESNGRLSVLKRAQKSSVTIEDMSITKKSSMLSYPVIIDGQIREDVVQRLNLSREWLYQQLQDLNIKSDKDVFFASINTNHELHISLKSYMEEDKSGIAPVLN